MKFAKRLRAYLIGVGVGILLVVILFKDKTALFTAWLPQNRVVLELSEKKWSATIQAQCQLTCLGLSLAQVNSQLKDEQTEVDFSSSKTQQSPKIYCLIQTHDKVPSKLMVEIADSTVSLLSISSSKLAKCTCPN